MSATGQRIAIDQEVVTSAAPGTHSAKVRAACASAGRAEGGRIGRRVAYGEAVLDFLTVFALVLAAEVFAARPHGIASSTWLRQEMFLSGLAAVITTLLLKNNGAYLSDGSMLRIRETERILRACAEALFILWPLTLLQEPHIAHAATLALVVPLTLVLERQLLIAIGRRRGGAHRVAVCGAGRAARQTISTLLASPRLRLRPVLVVDDDAEEGTDWISEFGYRRRISVPVRRGPVTASLLKSRRCDILLIATSDLAPAEKIAAARAAVVAGAEVAYLADLDACEWPHAESIDIDSPIVPTTVKPRFAWCYPLLKRTTDAVFSFLLLVLLAPLLILVALLIRADSPGPALFIQRRVGRDGRLFDLYKFRSMYVDVPRYDFSPATSDDPRITPIGRFLRKTSLDELPQLVNVLLGDMSLVGPRPEMPFIVETYSALQRQRLQAAPGITGLWQLSADRIFPIHENIEYDLYYIRSRSYFLDLAVLLHTLFFAMRGV